jgi:hypothetical protein
MMLLTDDQSHAALIPGGMAFFSWDLSADKLYGDAVMADFFGLEPTAVASGIPILTVISKIADEDRPLVAESIHRAITTGALRQQRYRIRNERHGTVDVFSVGRCLRDGQGTPSIYNGTIIDAAAGVVRLESDALEEHCQSALGIAERRGNELAARYISCALRAIGGIGGITGAR